MSAGTKIVFSLRNANGNIMNMSYKYGNTEATAQSVRNALEAFISEGSIFRNVPVTWVGAKTVVTTESEFDLSDTTPPNA